LVPTVRLELTRLSSLPPQDSVSTNFTTSAAHNYRCTPAFIAKQLNIRDELYNNYLHT
jgi:hypothetical protein